MFVYYQLLFIEEIDDVTESKKTSSSSYHNDVTWISGVQLKSFSSFTTHDHFINFVLSNSFCEPSLVVYSEHHRNDPTSQWIALLLLLHIYHVSCAQLFWKKNIFMKRAIDINIMTIEFEASLDRIFLRYLHIIFEEIYVFIHQKSDSSIKSSDFVV